MAKKSNEKATKPVKTRKRKESVESDASDVSSETPSAEVTSSPPSKKELRAAAKAQKKAGNSIPLKFCQNCLRISDSKVHS